MKCKVQIRIIIEDATDVKQSMRTNVLAFNISEQEARALWQELGRRLRSVQKDEVEK